MREFGVNCDPRHWDTYDELASAIQASGALWVRTVILPDSDLTPWIDACHNHGLKVLGVIASESLPGWDPSWYAADMAYQATAYATQYAETLDAWQIGNESDQVGDSSWTMRPTELNRLLKAFRAALPERYIVGPGMASGQPYHYDTRLVDAQAIHPYLDPDTLRTIGLHATPNGQPLWVTEYPASEGMSAAIADEEAWTVAMAFAWSDRFIGAYGLVDVDDNPNPVYAEFKDAASVPQEETDTMATNPYQAEFDAARKEIGKSIIDQTPQSPYYDGPGLPEVAWSQCCDGAVLVRYKGVDGVYALTDARAVKALAPKA